VAHGRECTLRVVRRCSDGGAMRYGRGLCVYVRRIGTEYSQVLRSTREQRVCMSAFVRDISISFYTYLHISMYLSICISIYIYIYLLIYV
jgi:hypothetical protein